MSLEIDRMAKTDFKSVDEYLATLPEATRRALERVRAAILEAVPHLEEGISYQIPTYKLRGARVIYFAGWKEHYSIYPATATLVAAFKDDLAPYKVEKGTIRFPLAKVPVTLIAQLAKHLASEAAERKRRPT